MDSEKLAEFREILLREKERFRHQNDLIEYGRNGYGGLKNSFSDSVGELSTYDNHPADQADIIFERSKDIALKDNNSSFLIMIDDALHKIDEGTYGICDHCGRQIAESRLEVFPYTTMCVECKDLMEHFDPPRSRPIEEELLDPPFYRTFTDDSDNVVFDGEDTWQKVARYGTSNTPQDVPGAITSDDAYYDADERQGEVGWGDGIEDAGFTEEFAEDEFTGNPTRSSREEFQDD